ncbi:NifU family protein [Olsenella sp. CA-Schmier-601-WT-1]|uniref:NifU family protein n=1 Tax=Olsenella porci TaxID=2652279 RepID=A0A6N7XRC2_9ACTN|nr:NifU family protein [Olsenella porci]
MAENQESTEPTAEATGAAEGQAPKVNRELLEATIDVIRQSLQADGGDVVLVSCDDDGVVTLEMQGACAGCPLSTYDMSEGIERILKEHVPGVTKVQPAMAW